MAIDVELEFRRGGRTALEFLSYCVLSYRLEPVFDWLVRDYRTRPTIPGALALFEGFCAPRAPGRLAGASTFLPPRELLLLQEVERLRGLLPGPLVPADPRSMESTAEGEQVHPALPPAPAPRHLFDALVVGLRSADRDLVLLPGEDFDPALTAVENLPGGTMTSGQRSWVERVWQAELRPGLVGAGFWRVATVG